MMSAASLEAQLSNYGNVNLGGVESNLSAAQRWTKVEDLSEEMAEREVLVSGRVDAIVGVVSVDRVSMVLREGEYTVQCVAVASDKVSQPMLKFVSGLIRGSTVLVEGFVSVPSTPIKSAEILSRSSVEVQLRSIYCLSSEDPAMIDVEIKKAVQQVGKQFILVNQGIRVLGARTPVTRAIFRLQGEIENEFRRFLLSKDFIGIHSQSLMSGSSKFLAACPTQPPQFYKQLAICGYPGRVFEISPVYEVEPLFAHRHRYAFTGLDVEMQIKEHYSEIIDMVDCLFVAIFDHLNKNCKKELECMNKQYPFEPLKYLRTTLRLSFEEAVEMLKASGVEADPFEVLSTEAKRKLSQLVLEKYDTEFYIVHQCPLAARAFYTMPCEDNNLYSNSFDVFMRGVEIVSGGQRVRDVELLAKRADACGIDVNSISTYLNIFRSRPLPPHCGFGFGLEQFMTLFCNLGDYNFRFESERL